MEGFVTRINIFIIPPVLFLITGVSLAAFSLIKGKRQKDTIYFALLCLWFSLLSPIFISHHLFRGDMELIMTIERSIHVVYVFVPWIGILFIHTMVGYQNRVITIGAFILSAILSLSVFTDYYVYGLWEYSWGYMAKGGIIFQVFGAYSFIGTIYGIIRFLRKMKTETDDNMRLKLKYLYLAMLFVSVLTICNIPAMNGINFYPLGNFAFIPMIFMAWGIFRHDVIRINRYTRQRMLGTVVRTSIVAGLLIIVGGVVWLFSNHYMGQMISKTIPYGLPPLISFIVCLFFSMMIFSFRDNSRESSVFSMLALAYAFLSLDIYVNSIITDSATGLRVSRACHALVVFLPALLTHLIRSATERRSERPVLWFIYAAGFALLPFTQSDLYLQGIYRYSWGFFAKKALLFDIFSLLTGFSIVYCIIIVIMAYRREERAYYKRRLMYVFIGAAFIALLSLGNFPALNGYDVYPAGNFIFIPMVIFAVGLFRNNIAAMVRLAAAAVRYGMMAFVLIGAAFGASLFRDHSFLPAIFAAFILLVILFSYFWNRLSNYLFHGRKAGLRKVFEQLGKALSRGRNYAELGNCVSCSVFNDLFARWCAVLFFSEMNNAYRGMKQWNPQQGIFRGKSEVMKDMPLVIGADEPLTAYLGSRNTPVRQVEIEEWLIYCKFPVPVDDPIRLADIAIPVFFEDRLYSIILLGPKTDGSVYSTDELEFLYQLGLSFGPYIEKDRILQHLEIGRAHV